MFNKVSEFVVFQKTSPLLCSQLHWENQTPVEDLLRQYRRGIELIHKQEIGFLTNSLI